MSRSSCLTRESLKGAFPAIVTPFTGDGGALDLSSYRELLDYQLTLGVSGVVVCGSTGETVTLTDDEYREMVSVTREHVGSRGFVIAGIGANSTARAVELARYLDTTGVDGILLVTPPYNKPTQAGILAHFEAVRGSSALPIIAYNVPGRTGINLQPRTVEKMVDRGLIIGLKESSGSMDQILDIVALTDGRLALLSGEDSLVHATMASGGCGVVSVTANVVPDLVSNLTTAALEGRWEDARKLQLEMLPIARACFVETNPIPIKAALYLKGIIRHPTTRLPLTPAEPSTVEQLKRVLGL